MKPHLPLGLRSVLLPAVAALAVFAPAAFAIENDASGTYDTALVNPFDNTLEYAQWVRNLASTGGYTFDSAATSAHVIAPAANTVIQLTPTSTSGSDSIGLVDLSGSNVVLEKTDTNGNALTNDSLIVNANINADSVWFKTGRYSVTSASVGVLANAGHLYLKGGQLWINTSNNADSTITNKITLGSSDYVETGNTAQGLSNAAIRLDTLNAKFTGAVTVAENTKIGYRTGARLTFADLTLATGATLSFGKYTAGSSSANLALSLTGALRLTGDGLAATGIDSNSVDITLGGDFYLDLSGYHLESGGLIPDRPIANFTLGNVTSDRKYAVINGQEHLGYVTFNNGVATFETIIRDMTSLSWTGSTSVEWNTTDSNWQRPTGDAAVFTNGNNIQFYVTENATITVTEAVAPGHITVTNSTITLTGAADGSITGPMLIDLGSQVTLDNIKYNGTITLDHDARLTLKQTDSLSSTDSVLGGGIIEVDWGSSLGLIDADLSTWGGTLFITSGRYTANNSSALANLAQTKQIIVTGGQFYVASGTCASDLTISGNGWTSSNDAYRQGALVIGGQGGVSGTITLAGDTGVQMYKAGTISGVIVGNGHTLSKYGADLLTISESLTELSLIVEAGAVRFGAQKTYDLDVVTVRNGASLQGANMANLNVAELNMENGSTLDLYIGGNATHTFDAMNVNGTVTVKNQQNGVLNIAGAIVGVEGGTNTLRFTTGNGTNNLNLQSNISGQLNILKDVDSTLNMSGKNTYEGDTTVSAGTLNVSGSIAGASNTYMADGGTIKVSGESGTISNSAVNIVQNGSTEASIQNATVGTTSIEKTTGDGTKGSVQDAIVTLEADVYSINNIELVNSLIDMQSSGNVQLNNVTIGAGTTVSNQRSGSVVLNDSQLVMTVARTEGTSLANETLSITSTGLAGYTTISGSLTFDLTKEWVDNLVSSVDGNFTTIKITFTDADIDVWNTFKANVDSSLALAGALNNEFYYGPATVDFDKTDQTTATVIITSTKNIPEPATATLGLLGLSSLLLRRRRKA